MNHLYVNKKHVRVFNYCFFSWKLLTNKTRPNMRVSETKTQSFKIFPPFGQKLSLLRPEKIMRRVKLMLYF